MRVGVETGVGLPPKPIAPEAPEIMTSRTRTFAAFFTVALAATLLGALFTTHAEPQPPQEARGHVATATAVPVAL